MLGALFSKLGAVFSKLGAVFRSLKVGLFIFRDGHWPDRSYA